MKTHHSLLATFFLIAFLQILPVQAQRSSEGRGVNWTNPFMGYNIQWDFYDGVLRIWSVENHKNPVGSTHWSWKDCIPPYKAYMKDPVYSSDDEWNFHPEGSEWYGLEGISPAYPPFTETPWYPIRELVRQIQIDGSIYIYRVICFVLFPKLQVGHLA